MGKKEVRQATGDRRLVDAILGTLSTNFQRAVMYNPPGEGPYWRDGKLINEAIESLKKNLRILISGFDEQVADFVKKLREDVMYKAPEQGTQAMTERFLAFRTLVLSGKPKVSIPISFGKKSIPPRPQPKKG
jgi:hypothetical protein